LSEKLVLFFFIKTNRRFHENEVRVIFAKKVPWKPKHQVLSKGLLRSHGICQRVVFLVAKLDFKNILCHHLLSLLQSFHSNVVLFSRKQTNVFIETKHSVKTNFLR
jgi:hypothetical protein